MLLIEIDKKRYRQRLNMVIAACIGFLVVSSLVISQTLIYFFPAQQGSHFHWNLLGVVSSALIVVAVLIRNKKHAFLHEVFYVWQLKQALNLITRKMLKLQQAAKMGDKNAMLAMQFSYTGSRKLWLLDDNTLTLDNLDEAQLALTALLLKYNFTVDITQYNSALLKSF